MIDEEKKGAEKDYVVLELEESEGQILGIAPMIVSAANPRQAVKKCSEANAGREFSKTDSRVRYRTCTLDSMGNYLTRVKWVTEIESE